MLRPEVKSCLDKIMYQLDLCKNTLGLLEKRISSSESNLHSVMEFIRTEDINYKPHLAQAVVEVNDSPEKAAHLYHPHLYREQLNANTALLSKYAESKDSISSDRGATNIPPQPHRTVTHALLASPCQISQKEQTVTISV